MRLRKPCAHGMYDDHAGLIHEEPYKHCPGGEFLPEDALVIERIEGEWPWSVLETVWVHSGGSAEGLLRGFDALADQVGEPR